MDEKKKLASQPRQVRHYPFRDVYLVISGTMLFCELLLLVVLFWKHPSLVQMHIPLLLLVSGTVLMPLILGILAHSARTPFQKKRKSQQNTRDLLS